MDITDPKQNKWVKGMKTNGVYVGNKGSGNCALYSLVVYFTSVFSKEQRDWLLRDYNPKMPGFDWMEKDVNMQPLFDPVNTNRSKFIIIFNESIEAKIKFAQDNLGEEDNTPTWLKQKRWKETFINKELSCKLIEYTIKYTTLQALDTDMDKEYIPVTPSEYEQDDQALQQHYDQMDKFYIDYLKLKNKNERWLCRGFICEVIDKVATDAGNSRDKDQPQLVFPWIVSEKKGGVDVVDFVKQVPESPDVFSPVMFVHTPGHWEVVVQKQMLQGKTEYLKKLKCLYSNQEWEPNYTKAIFKIPKHQEQTHEVEIPDDDVKKDADVTADDNASKKRKYEGSNSNDNDFFFGFGFGLKHNMTEQILRRLQL